MTYLWRLLTAWLVWLSSDPSEASREHPKAAAAVMCARASMVSGSPAPAPKPTPDKCCGECKGTGFITHGDGHRTPCPCPPTCKCKQKQAKCPDGKCSGGTQGGY
jgi:hypothetical protein